MNIIIFSFFIIYSLLGIKKETISQKNTRIFYYGYFLLFIICGLTRIGNSPEYSDLTNYVFYFNNDRAVYFEPGYLWLTQVIKDYFGGSPYTLITIIGSIIVLCIYFSTEIIKNGEYNNKYNNRGSFRYGFTLIAIYLTYWGLAFEAERLRIGIATSLFILSFIAILYGKNLISLFLICIAVTFQYTITITIPILLLAKFSEKSKNFLALKRKSFLIWYIILVGLRIGLYLVGSVGPVVYFLGSIQNIIGLTEMNHYDSYVSQIFEGGGGISLKELFYYVCGYFMIRKEVHNTKYKIIVFVYFLGLSLSVFLIGFSAGHRISDIFISVNCIAVAYMGWMKLMPNKAYWLYLLAIVFMQSIMSVNYLGVTI